MKQKRLSTAYKIALLITYINVTTMKLKPLLIVALLCGSIPAMSQDDSLKSMDIYGFVMTDAGYNANQIDPNWYDVIRTTKLPAYKNQYGPDGNTYFSVRQTRFGVKGYTNTPLGLLYTQFEWELFGTGVDAGANHPAFKTCLWRNWQVWRRTILEPFYGH